MNIDLNRGVTIRRHPTSGVQVYMYKDTPGIFLNAHGNEVDPSLAEACGFDTNSLVKDKLKRERMALAMATIEAEFNEDGGAQEVIKSIGDFKLVHIGMGRHKVLDPEGEALHDTPVTLEVGELLLKQLTHTPPEQPEEVVEPEVVSKEKLVDPKSKVGFLADKLPTPVYPKPPLAHVDPTDKDKLAKVAKAAKSKSKK